MLTVIDPNQLREVDLFEVARAADSLRAGFGPGQCREKEGGQNRDNRDNYQQLDERESTCSFLILRHTNWCWVPRRI